MTTYRDLTNSIRRGFAWTTDGTLGERYIGTTSGLVWDAWADGASQAVRSPWLSIGQRLGRQPPDALPPLGAMYAMPRYSIETSDQWRDRMLGKWAAWEFAGNEDGGTVPPGGILGQLAAFGLPDAVIVTAQDWPTRPPSPHWSQFWLVIPDGTHSVGPAHKYGVGENYGNPLNLFVYGADTDPLFAASLRKLICQWKPGHVVARQALFENGGTTYGTGALYADPGLVYGGDVGAIDLSVLC
jgi:hypothetical protein